MELSHSLPCPKHAMLARQCAVPLTQQSASAMSHSSHIRGATQQTFLLCHTAHMSATSHSRHVCCLTLQTCLLRDTADMPAM